MSTDDVLLGLGLVLVLAVGSQLVAGRLRLPAIVVLLPVGFVAGIADRRRPPRRSCSASSTSRSCRSPSGVILFEAGLRLSFARGRTRRPRDWSRASSPSACSSPGAGVAAAVRCCSTGSATASPLLIGAILVVSGPTVVLPLLSFVRPASRRPLAPDVGGRARRSRRRAARRRSSSTRSSPARAAARSGARARCSRASPSAPRSAPPRAAMLSLLLREVAADGAAAGRPGRADDGHGRPRRRRPAPRRHRASSPRR